MRSTSYSTRIRTRWYYLYSYLIRSTKYWGTEYSEYLILVRMNINVRQVLELLRTEYGVLAVLPYRVLPKGPVLEVRSLTYEYEHEPGMFPTRGIYGGPRAN